jgi:hypothetical protein
VLNIARAPEDARVLVETESVHQNPWALSEARPAITASKVVVRIVSSAADDGRVFACDRARARGIG